MSYFIDGLKKYAVFDGRAARRQFWFFLLWYIIFSIIAGIIDALINTPVIISGNGIIGSIFLLATFLPMLGIEIRRLHDINKSGLWVLINLIPLVGTIYFLYLMSKKGDYGVNDYGAPVYPLAADDPVDVKYERVDKESE